MSGLQHHQIWMFVTVQVLIIAVILGNSNLVLGVTASSSTSSSSSSQLLEHQIETSAIVNSIVTSESSPNPITQQYANIVLHNTTEEENKQGGTDENSIIGENKILSSVTGNSPSAVVIALVDDLDNEVETSVHVQHDDLECRIYFAESTIPNAGWGLFAGVDIKKDEEVTVSGDALVPILNIKESSLISKFGIPFFKCFVCVFIDFT
jgi:hypothetical protein